MEEIVDSKTGRILIKSQSDEVNGYHLRVTSIETDDAKKFLGSILDLFIDKFNPKVYIAGYEEVKENKHMHVHIEYGDNIPKRQTLSDFFKKNKLSGKYYHQKIKTTNQQNKLYITKDLDLIKHNVTEEEIEEILEETKQISCDRKKDARKKILDAFVNHLIEYQKLLENQDIMETSVSLRLKMSDLNYVALFIHKLYINEWDKEPPTYKMKGYVLYVAEKINQMEELTMFTYDIEKYYHSFM